MSQNNFEENGNILEILAEILYYCIVPQYKISLIYEESFSPKMMEDCLTQLKLFGFIEECQNLGKYATTPRGIEYLRRWAHSHAMFTQN